MSRPALGCLLLLTVAVACPGAADAAPKRARVTVFLLPAQGYTPQQVSRVSNALQKALAGDPRLEVRDSDKLLIEFSGEVPTERINQGRAAYEEGLQSLRGGRPTEAIPRLEQAVAAYEEVLAFVKKELLARAWLALGAAEASANQTRKAYSTFQELLTWRPLLAYDTTLFDAEHLPLFEKARAAVKKLKRGSAELITDPPGARAYVDGRFMGVTPTVVFGLRVGNHYATYKQAGYIKAAHKITVSATEQARFSLTLNRSEKFLLLQQSIEAAKRTLGKPVASPEMVSLQSFLAVDQVIFATMGYAGPGRLAVQAFLYDLRSKLRLSSASATLDQRQLQEVAGLTRSLYANVRTDGSLEAPPDAPPPPAPKRRRFYATWWFWSAIAVGAAAVTMTVVFWPEDQRCGPECRWASLR